jgi:hypothetical protein
MRDVEIRQVQTMDRINDFASTRGADFPASSLGGRKFTEVVTLLAELDALGQGQARANGAAQASTEAKRAARAVIVRWMRAIRETAKAMESEHPGISNNFRLPTANGDEALVNSARAFVVAAETFKAEFIQRELPATFLDDLSDAIAEFERASSSLNLNTTERVRNTAALKSTLARAAVLRKELHPIVTNKYRDDSASLAAWKNASRVERPPKTRKPKAE